MKHLKKYNESKEEDIINYISDCFIEFIDTGAEVKYNPKRPNYNESYTIIIKVPDCWFSSGHTLIDNIKSTETLLEFYKDIENCLEKVTIKYPNFKQVYTTNNDGHIKEIEILFINI